MKAKTIVIMILVILTLVLIAQNTAVMPIQLLFWQITMSRIVLIVLMFAIGFALGFIIAKATGRKQSPPKEV
ncbi:LapA family protein [candidate division WOR-3 bacterium]|nr:LapA family protein [candidate division WOR-3 bacterium]